jgi:hypothetical protein
MGRDLGAACITILCAGDGHAHGTCHSVEGHVVVADYFIKMKGLADEMALAGRKLEDEELVSYILIGLGEDFDSVV